MGAQNALDLIRLGRLATPYGASYEVAHEERVYRLRHYRPEAGAPAQDAEAPVLLLVPPLMVTAEIYDISPELSAVTHLVKSGVDTYVCDFGAPEEASGGMERTLDDHIRAVVDAVARVRDRVGRDVHLAGYSQGGMFCYQAAAYARCHGIASVITFGSPVDIHRSLPGLADHLAARVIGVLNRIVETPLERMDGLPGFLTSTGFKVLSFRKELQQLADFVAKLHDRQALERRERSRRFLAGEGFVAWPGPALRTFVDEFIVHNRMMVGGFVVNGRTVTLADIDVPILYFVGTRDDIARPAAVRAIRGAVPNAEPHEVDVKAGHFGLVVGSRSLTETWPTVVQWLQWREGRGPVPERLRQPEPAPAPEDGFDAEVGEIDFDLFYDVVVDTLRTAWNGLEERARGVERSLDALRWQLPRLTRLQAIDADTRISPAVLLAQRASDMPDGTFFLYHGRAFSYAQADRRVDNVVRGLFQCGVRPGHRVAIAMGRRPSYLTTVAAASRMGAVAVLFGSDRVPLAEGLARTAPDFVVADPEQAAAARRAFGGPVLVLGGGGPDRDVPEGVIDMEAIDPDAVALPEGFAADAGRAEDLALVMFTTGADGRPQLSQITNRRWAVSALGAAAACTLSPKDTVYCCLPLFHPGGFLVGVGGALVSGARLALASRFAPDVFWEEVRRYGASVVFYANEMCRDLVNAPVQPGEARNPIRLLAGSGMRADVWRKVRERFGSTGVLEFYATTEGGAVLANASGRKLGALGRPLPGSTDIAVVRYDLDRDELVRTADGRAVPCDVDEPGVLVARLDAGHPATRDGGDRARVARDLFEPGDAWAVTRDLVRVDTEDDHWFVDRVRDVIRSPEGPVYTRQVEDVLYTLPEVALAVVYGLEGARDTHESGSQRPMAALRLREGARLDPAHLAATVTQALPPHARPTIVRFPTRVEMTEGHRPLKAPLVAEGPSFADDTPCWRWDEAAGAYRIVAPQGAMAPHTADV
jgi:putative long chain acyl-CoA synthase